MMRKLKIAIPIIALVIFAVATLPNLIFNSGLPADDKVFNSQEFYDLMGGYYDGVTLNRKIGKTIEGSISLDGVFADHPKAIIEIKKMLKPFLYELSLKYSLPEFSEEVIDQYQEALYLYRESDYRASKGAPMYKLSALSFFCQTYKNSANNAEILRSKGVKSDVENVMSYLFKTSSAGYIQQPKSFDSVKIIVSEMLEYMKTTFELDLLTDETIPAYLEHLDEVPDEPYGMDKEILKTFFEIYKVQ